MTWNGMGTYNGCVATVIGTWEEFKKVLLTNEQKNDAKILPELGYLGILTSWKCQVLILGTFLLL